MSVIHVYVSQFMPDVFQGLLDTGTTILEYLKNPMYSGIVIYPAQDFIWPPIAVGNIVFRPRILLPLSIARGSGKIQNRSSKPSWHQQGKIIGQCLNPWLIHALFFCFVNGSLNGDSLLCLWNRLDGLQNWPGRGRLPKRDAEDFVKARNSLIFHGFVANYIERRGRKLSWKGLRSNFNWHHGW